MSGYKYSIVIPVYRSSNTLAELFMQIKSVFDKTTDEFEVVFVEDGGMDDSWRIISDLKARYPEFIVVKRLERNTGQHHATVCGFELCRGDFIFTIDDDLQILPGEMLKLINKQQQTGADLVYGTYLRQKQNFLVGLARALVVSLVRMLYKLDEFGSSFRLVKRNLVELVLDNRSQPLAFDSVLVWEAQRIAYQKVEQRDNNSASGYTVFGLTRFTVELVFGYFYLALALNKGRPSRLQPKHTPR
jgi:undecaprenyl-phosphate 4-deoxy-4-formamido-L-arabinose transferase